MKKLMGSVVLMSMLIGGCATDPISAAKRQLGLSEKTFGMPRLDVAVDQESDLEVEKIAQCYVDFMKSNNFTPTSENVKVDIVYLGREFPIAGAKIFHVESHRFSRNLNIVPTMQILSSYECAVGKAIARNVAQTELNQNIRGTGDLK